MRLLIRIVCLSFFLLSCVPAQAKQRPSPALMGELGLNIVPSARMDEVGTARAVVATADPYLHAMASLQLTDFLNIGIRQTVETGHLHGDPDHLFPGVDLRLRLGRESAYMPEITLGLQSVFGDKRMASEYLALSKRYKNFDVTGGMAWGRMGSDANMVNPLGILSKHFGRKRPLGGDANAPHDWFTGEDIGFFGGVEYFVPQVSGLSLKADWSGDRYLTEKNNYGYNPPSPWALGFNYAPASWISVGAALIGGKKVMGRIALQSPVKSWFGRTHKEKAPPSLRTPRTAPVPPDDIRLYVPRIKRYSASALLPLDPDRSTPQQLGRAARALGNHGGETLEALSITPLSCGLQGPEITLQRRDLEQAVIRHQGSPQEIWRSASFTQTAQGHSPFYDLIHDHFNPLSANRMRIILDNQTELAKRDGLFYRTSLILQGTSRLAEHFWAGGDLRFGAANNLKHLRTYHPQAAKPIRSDIDRFASRRAGLDRAFLSWMTTIKPDLHVALTAGYLEEMYGGAGGEILYRPFGKRFSIGAEAYQVYKRDPGFGFNGDHTITGHLQAWYEFPDSDITLQARIGRYLAGDTGGTLALQKRFDNGANVQAFVTATNRADFDIYGSRTNVYSGVKLSLPLGNVKYIPEGSEARVTVAPLGRDAGQSLDAPIKLYDVSEPLSMRHIAHHWTDVVD